LTLKGKVIGILPFGKVKFPNPGTLGKYAGRSWEKGKVYRFKRFLPLAVTFPKYLRLIIQINQDEHKESKAMDISDRTGHSRTGNLWISYQDRE
jgi:hypothetical protein